MEASLLGQELFCLFLFLAVCGVLLLGYPVAFTLAGTSLCFAMLGIMTGHFDEDFLTNLPSRLYGIMRNDTLIAVPLFVFMGLMLQRSKVAENLLETMSALFGSLRGGLAISVTLVGMILAASTGIVGATVVTMGLLSLPTMMRHRYDPAIATGAICASGTLGQIIPPSIILVLLGDVLSSAYQKAQIDILKIFAPETVSVGDLFLGAVIPGLLLVSLYLVYILLVAWFRPQSLPPMEHKVEVNMLNLLKVLFPPLFLILAVLGSIVAGAATPTEAASVGALGSIVLAALNKQLDWARIKDVVQSTTHVTSMVFMVLIGASIFSAVFRGFQGDEIVQSILSELPGGVIGAMLIVMLLMFLLGFILDFIEITFVVIPIVAPSLLAMGLDPVWLGIMFALNLQTSFMTPPFGFALFYLRGVAPPEIKTSEIYKGVIPFIIIQIIALLLLALWPGMATWLPNLVFPG